MSKLNKTKTVFLQQPYYYEISGCECGNEHTQWSEYEEHVWCDNCQIDFKPEFGGVFDGPIPVGTSALLGVFFHRLNLENNEVEFFTSKGKYVSCINFIQKNKGIVNIKTIECDDYNLNINLSNFEIEGYLKEDIHEIYFGLITTKKKIEEWKLIVKKENNNIVFIQNDDLSLFMKTISNQRLESSLEIKQTTKQNKI